jgi:hypothetical protein
MQKNKNRQGLALGAIVALVSSLFVMTAPAQASETSVVVYPTSGLETQTTMIHGESFDLTFRFGTGVASSLKTFAPDTSTGFGVEITKPAGVSISAQIAGAGASTRTNAARNPGNFVDGTSASSTVEDAATMFNVAANSSGSPKIYISLPGSSSVSSSVALTVTPYLDINKDGDRDAGEPYGTAIAVNFVPWSSMGATLSVGTPIVGEHNVTASFAVTAGNLNWSQLDSDFKFTVTDGDVPVLTTVSENITAAQLSSLTAATPFTSNPSGAFNSTGSARAYSASYGLETTTSAAGNTFSANVKYGNVLLVTSATATVGALTVGGTTVSPVTGDNIVRTAATTADARVNSAFTLAVYPYSASITTSVAVASVLTIAQSAGVYSVDTGVSVNGTLYTSSAALEAAEIAIPAGTTTVAIATVGQTGTPVLTVTLTSQLKTSLLTVNVKGSEQVPVVTETQVAGTAGSAKTFAVTAKDQWGVASVRTDQRIAASVVLGGSTSTTVSAALVNAATSITVTPNPATRTGSAIVTFTLETLTQATQLWAATATRDTVSWNIYTYAAGTDSITSRTVSVSGTISYGVVLSWSETVAVVIANSFSDVVASAPGLMIQNADSVKVTASDVLTIAANGKTANFKFTSRLAGTYTVTFTNGTATTTSTVVVAAAAHDSGATLTFDKTSIAAGTTTTVTGTLKDVNGNPVMTSGSSDVSVAWTGKGLPFGNTTTMETDAAGQLTFYVLVLSGEVGDAAISATYKPAGLAVSTKNVSVVHAVAVGKAAASADQKVNVGTFKGYVALYAKGYEGQKMSAIVAGKWIVVASLASDFERVVRFTGAGYTITTKIYIDGVQIGDEFTTVTK